MHLAVIQSQFKTIMDKPFSVHTLTYPGLAQQIDHALLQYPGANPPQDVFTGLALDDDVVDSGVMQQLTQQQARRSSADNSDLSSHYCSLEQPRPCGTRGFLFICACIFRLREKQ